MILEVGYFLIAIDIFLLYFLVFSIFGYIIYSIMERDSEEKRISLEVILKSFAIGTVIQIIYSMIIVSYGLFNFFTIYLPFIIIDLTFISYVLLKKRKSIKNSIKTINNQQLIKVINTNKVNITIITLTLILLFLLQMSFINRFIPYQSSDPYHWFYNIWYLHEQNELNYASIGYYSPGFILFSTSMITITDDYYTIYFFLKYLPFFLSSINILVLYTISKEFFEKKINIFFTLVVYMSFSFLCHRYTDLLASILATTLGFLFLLILKKSNSSELISNHMKLKSTFINQNIIYKAIILTGILMAHPLYGLVFICSYLLYELYFFIRVIFKKFNISRIKLIFIFKFLMLQTLLVGFIILMLLPYLISSSIHYQENLSLIEGIKNRLGYYVVLFNTIKFLFLSILGFLNCYAGVNIRALSVILSQQILIDTIDFLIIGIITVGIIFIFFKESYFKMNEKQKYILKFFISTFLIMSFSYLIIFLMSFAKNPEIQILYNFLVPFSFRFFELFAGFWAIIFVFSINYFFIFIKKLYFKIKRSNKPSKRIVRCYKISQLFSIITIASLLYVSNYHRAPYINYFNDDQGNSVIAAGDYLNKNPIEKRTAIFLEATNYTFLYNLIKIDNLDHFYYIFNDSVTYAKFKFDFDNAYYVKLIGKAMWPTYTIFNLSSTSITFQSGFLMDFNIFYQGQNGYIFAKIKDGYTVG